MNRKIAVTLKAAWLVLVSAGAVVLSRWLMGEDGTLGSLLGVGLGVVLCIVSFAITNRVRRAENPNLKLVAVGVILSFVLLVSFVLAVRYLAPDLVKPAALTALAVYLAYRGVAVLELRRPAGIVAGGAGGLSLSTLSGTSEAESGKEAR